jgi:hypothetical protein
MSFGALIKIRNKNHKRIFIETVQKMVIKNTEIAIWCGMMMHHILMNCVSNGIAVPTFTYLSGIRTMKFDSILFVLVYMMH